MRNIRFDTLRGTLIWLVVFGHLIEPAMKYGGSVRDVYILIYLFHMPLFVGVSGYFSKTKTSVQTVFKSILIPFLLAEAAFRVFHYALGGASYPLTQPYWHLWFLLSLACWRLTLPHWMHLRFPLSIAIVMALIAGGIDAIGLSFSLSRTIYFFPFFILGHQLAGREYGIVFPRWMAVAILIVAAVAVTQLPNGYSVNWLQGSLGYMAQGVSMPLGAAIRLAHYVASVLLAIAVLALIPQKKSILTTIGQSTLAIYIGHGFIVLILTKYGLGQTNGILLLLAFALAWGIVLLLHYTRRFNPFRKLL